MSNVIALDKSGSRDQLLIRTYEVVADKSFPSLNDKRKLLKE